MVARTAASLLVLLGAVSARPQLGGVPVVSPVVSAATSIVVTPVVSLATSVVDTALGSGAATAVSPVVSLATSIVDTVLGGGATDAAGATTAAGASPTDVVGGLTSAADSVVATAVPSVASSLLGSSGLPVTSAVDSVVATAVPSIVSSLLGSSALPLDSLTSAVDSVVATAVPSVASSLLGSSGLSLGNITSAADSVVATAVPSIVTSLVNSALSGLPADATSSIGSILSSGTPAEITSLINSILPTGPLVSDVSSILATVVPSNSIIPTSAIVSDATSLIGSLLSPTATALNNSALPTGILSNLTSSGLLGSLPTQLPINATSSGLLSNLTSTGASSSATDSFNGTFSNPFRPVSATSRSSASITGAPSASASSTGGLSGNFSNPFRPVSTTSRSMFLNSSSTATPSSTSSSVSMVPTPTNYPSSLIFFDGVLFLIEIDINYRGVLLDLAILFKKRDMNDLDNCLTTCVEETQCAATSFDSDTGVCTFYTSIDSGSRMFDNSTTFATVISRPTNSTGPTNSTAAESLICPTYNGHVITSSVGNSSFAVGCGEFLIGTTFDIKKDLTKRQAMDTGLPLTLSNCVDICALSKTCVGTVFDIDNNKCTYYSEVDYAMAMAGFDSATKVANHKDDSTTTTTATATTTAYAIPPGITAGPGASGTTYSAIVYTTSVSTVFSYAPASASVFYGPNGQPTTVMTGGYPAGATVTSMVAVGPTQYVNNVPTAAFAAPTTTVTVTVNNGNAAGAGGAAGGPTVTVHDCPMQTSFTTMYV